MAGPRSRKISGEVEAALRGVLAESNRLSLAECRDRLAERTGVHVSHLDGWPSAAPDGLDVKEAEPAGGRAGG